MDTKDIKPMVKEIVKEVKTFKVEFISSLGAKNGKYAIGEVVELTEDIYEIAKRYNAIKEV